MAPSLRPMLRTGSSPSRSWNEDSGLITCTPANCDSAAAKCADRPSLKWSVSAWLPPSAPISASAESGAGSTALPASPLPAASDSTASTTGGACAAASCAAISAAALGGDAPANLHQAKYPTASKASTAMPTATRKPGLRGSGLINRPSSSFVIHRFPGMSPSVAGIAPARRGSVDAAHLRRKHARGPCRRDRPDSPPRRATSLDSTSASPHRPPQDHVRGRQSKRHS